MIDSGLADEVGEGRGAAVQENGYLVSQGMTFSRQQRHQRRRFQLNILQFRVGMTMIRAGYTICFREHTNDRTSDRLRRLADRIGCELARLKNVVSEHTTYRISVH